MAEHGGYRRPSHPASVSGPGATSQRTDGKEPVMVAPGGDYGDRQDLENLQASAPIQSPDQSQTGQAPSLEDLLGRVTPLEADSQNPDEPVTAGAASGAGPGPEALGVPQNDNDSALASAKALPQSVVRLMIRQSEDPSATDDFRRLVSQIVAARGGSA